MELHRSTVSPVDRVPEPGDLITAFSPQPGQCSRMIYSISCRRPTASEAPAWKGRLAGPDGQQLVCRGVPRSRAQSDQRGRRASDPPSI